MPSDFEQFDVENTIKQLKDSDSKITDKLKQLIKSNADIEKELLNINTIKNDTETRIRVLESINIEKIKDELHRLEKRISSLESKDDDNKEKWKRIFDFVVQLAWVCMAAWLLTKLGLQAPL